MNDRASDLVLPNGAIRYGIYDAAGALLRYEYIKPEDEPSEVGTPINKATLLTDATAAAYRLTGDDAIPTKAFDMLSFATQYAWTRRQYPTLSTQLDTAISTIVSGQAAAADVTTIYHATAITITKSGELTFTGAGTIDVSYNNYTNANTLKGKFWSTTPLSGTAVIYFTPAGAANATRGNPVPPYAYAVLISAQKVTLTISKYDKESLYSPNPNAYPKESTEADEWVFYGLFRDIYANLGAVTGTYTGDGAATRLIKLGFQPRAILVWAASGGYSGAAGWRHENGLALPTQATGAVAITADGITVFYTANTKMTNASGTIYNWVAWR